MVSTLRYTRDMRRPSSILGLDIERELRVIDRGEGVYLYDKHGRRYLDLAGGACVACIGHAVPEVIDEIAQWHRKISYVNRLHFTNEASEELADVLLGLIGPGFSRVFFATTGADAVEAAVKLAIQYQRDRGRPHRHKVISRLSSYHGLSLGALPFTGIHFMRDAGGWTEAVPKGRHIMPPFCHNCPLGLTYPGCSLACANDLERAIELEGPETVAAFIAEPFVLYPPPDDYFARIREICDRYDILFIADEVKTGCGRTGKPFALQHWGVTADLVTAAKCLTGGYAPLSAVMIGERIAQTVTDATGMFMHGATTTAHPASCATALAVQRYARDHRLYERVAPMGEQLAAMLRGLVDRHSNVIAATGRGLLQSLILRGNESSGGSRAVVSEILLEHGVTGWPAGWPHAMAINFAPPFTIEDAHVAEAGAALDAACAAIADRYPAPARDWQPDRWSFVPPIS